MTVLNMTSVKRLAWGKSYLSRYDFKGMRNAFSVVIWGEKIQNLYLPSFDVA